MAQALWDRGIELLEHSELDEMNLGDRTAYLRRLHDAQLDLGITNGPFQAYRRWQKLCKSVTDDVTGELCLRPQWSDGPACLTHAGLDQIDPHGAEERRKVANRARLAALAEEVLDEYTEVLADRDNEKYPPSDPAEDVAGRSRPQRHDLEAQ